MHQLALVVLVNGEMHLSALCNDTIIGSMLQIVGGYTKQHYILEQRRQANMLDVGLYSTPAKIACHNYQLWQRHSSSVPSSLVQINLYKCQLIYGKKIGLITAKPCNYIMFSALTFASSMQLVWPALWHWLQLTGHYKHAGPKNLGLKYTRDPRTQSLWLCCTMQLL